MRTFERFDEGKHDFDRMIEILALSVPQPAERARQWVPEFYEPESRDLYVVLESDVVIGIIGIVDDAGRERPEIGHIAVSPDHRNQGVGRFLVEQLAEHRGLRELEAETGVNNANGFYPACGFSIKSLGEKYPGVERFLCVRKFDCRK